MKNNKIYFTRLIRHSMIDYTHIKQTKGYNMTYDKLSKEVKKLLDSTEEKMYDLIHNYNENNEEEEIDTVDIHHLFSPLSDYIEDYSQ